MYHLIGPVSGRVGRVVSSVSSVSSVNGGIFEVCLYYIILYYIIIQNIFIFIYKAFYTGNGRHEMGGS
jgi:hypothetical protein